MKRIALLTVHTCPLLQPGSGWAGGMNVYVDELARALAREGVRVDIFTRRHSKEVPATVTVDKGVVLHHIDAGPPREIDPQRTHRFLGVFTDHVLDQLKFIPDLSLIHSHYWLSGWAGLRIRSATGLPQVHSFHTLGRVKDLNAAAGSSRARPTRLATEEEVIAGVDRIIASTESEKVDLIEHYGAKPEKICVAAPGVDHDLFTPGMKGPARMRMGWPDVPTVLFVGRIQALKGPDVALEAFARVSENIPGIRLVMVGAPSGPDGRRDFAALQKLVKERDLVNMVTFAEPVPHSQMADVYRASDVVLVPSRSESFGLVAAEAQASGVPVIAANTGGLAHVVPEGSGGITVEGWDPDDWAAAITRILGDAQLSKALSTSGPLHAESFSWERAVERIIEIYQVVT
ncbi:MAG: glycosyltransferase [Acidimicrobiia bacterium]